MRFLKNICKEKQEVLIQQLKQYKTEIEMSNDEYRELKNWVAAGNSPYDNGSYIYGENGWPLDFVSAQRAGELVIEWFGNLALEEQQELLHPTPEEHPHHQIELSFKRDEELPFQL